MYQVLEANGSSASGGTLILVSDGEENRRPYIRKVTSTLVQKSVKVQTLLISDKADTKLIKLAADTNGKSFFDADLYDVSGLLRAFRSIVTDEASGIPGVAPVEVSFWKCRTLVDSSNLWMLTFI